MKTMTLVVLLGLAAVGACLPLLAGKTAAGLTGASRLAAERLERGKYLVTFGGCSDCHTPLKFGPHGPEPDMTRFMSGHPESLRLPAPPQPGESPWFASTAGLTAWSGPWGISYSANLTPDENTGLGIWTEEMFIRAMRTGKHMGNGRDILPPMPWRYTGQLTDDDLRSVFAYLRSLPAVKNRVPDPVGPHQAAAYE